MENLNKFTNQELMETLKELLEQRAELLEIGVPNEEIGKSQIGLGMVFIRAILKDRGIQL